MTQKFNALLWILFLSYPLSMSAQVTLEMTYPTTNLHRVNWTFGGEHYWFANDSLREIKVFSDKHQLVNIIPYPSVPNAQVRILQGEYGVSQTTINGDNLLEFVWLIKDNATGDTRLQVTNEQRLVLFSYDNPFESISFSEIEGLPSKLFISEFEDGIDDYITRVHTLPTFNLENIYFRAFKLNRKKFGYAGEMYFYKDIVNKKMQIYNAKHRFHKSVKFIISGVYYDYDDEEYTDADDSHYVKDSLIEVSFSYTNNSTGDYGQIIMNEKGQTLLKSNYEYRIDRQKDVKDKLFAENWRNTTDNFIYIYSLPNTIPFKADSTLRVPIGRAVLKNYGETIYSGGNPLILSFPRRPFTKTVQLPSIPNYGVYVYYNWRISHYAKYIHLSDSLIHRDTLIETLYTLYNNSTRNFIIQIANDTGKVYQTIDSTRDFSINTTKGLPAKLFTKTGNSNPYNTKVWRLGGATTGVKETPSVLELKIYPNPSNGEMNVELLGNTEGGQFDVSVYNLLGQNVFSLKNNLSKQFILKKEQIGKGIFIVKISQGQNSISKKVLFD